MNVHIGRSHRGPKKQENLCHNAPNNSLNLSDADETRSESEHLENSTILKHTEEKSVQVENDLDLVLTGEVCENCEEELIGETLWIMPVGFYYDRWPTHNIRRSPVPGCNVSEYGEIYLKGTYTKIGTVVNNLTHTIYNVKGTGS